MWEKCRCNFHIKHVKIEVALVTNSTLKTSSNCLIMFNIKISNEATIKKTTSCNYLAMFNIKISYIVTIKENNNNGYVVTVISCNIIRQ